MNEVRSTWEKNPEMQDLLDRFLTLIPVQVSILERQFASGEVNELGRLAHQMKGTAGDMAFPSFPV